MKKTTLTKDKAQIYSDLAWLYDHNGSTESNFFKELANSEYNKKK